MVLCAIGVVDQVVDVEGGLLNEGYVFVDAARMDVAFVAHLGSAEPGAIAPFNGSDIEVFAEADNPYRHRLPQRAVEPP